jgi:predicted DsbA family dithiol-disulfide isomerase
VVEVFADLWCPFTHVGLRRLVEARATRERPDVGIRVRPWPLELVNGEPLAASFVQGEVETLRESVAPDLFQGFRPDRFPTSTLAGLHLTEAAYRSSLDDGEQVALELRDLLFERGENIADPSVLARVAAQHGLHPEAPVGDDPVEAALAEGRDRGVVGSPHFFVGSEGWFCPALDVQLKDGHLVIRSDPDAFSAFLDRCFEGGAPV